MPLDSSCELNEIFELIDTQPMTCTKVIDALAEYPTTKQDGRRFQRLRNGRLEAYMQGVRISRTLLITGIVISRPSVAECVVYHTRIETQFLAASGSITYLNRKPLIGQSLRKIELAPPLWRSPI